MRIFSWKIVLWRSKWGRSSVEMDAKDSKIRTRDPLPRRSEAEQKGQYPPEITCENGAQIENLMESDHVTAKIKLNHGQNPPDEKKSSPALPRSGQISFPRVSSCFMNTQMKLLRSHSTRFFFFYLEAHYNRPLNKGQMESERPRCSQLFSGPPCQTDMNNQSSEKSITSVTSCLTSFLLSSAKCSGDISQK
jgi:hypothetical protein